jgi:hypothetical protein
MKLREATAGALAAWQAMTMTGPNAPAAPPPQSPSPAALSQWQQMTGVPLSPPKPPADTGSDIKPGTVGGFGTPAPTTSGAGAWGSPKTGDYAGMGPATTPLRDNPTQLPALPPATNVPSTSTNPPPPPTDKEALDLAGYDPSQSAQAPPSDPRGLTVDEKRFVSGNELLNEANKQGYGVSPYLTSAGMKPLADQSAKPGIRLESGSTIAVTESFDKGTGIFSNVWGPGVDTSVAGQVTIRRYVDGEGKEVDSGTMLNPEGYGTKAGGYGYGLYTFDMSMIGNAPGPYALMWPGSNQWPGPEMDLVERQPGGQTYSTLHWAGEGNSNQFQSVNISADNGRHTYQYDWQPNALTVYVDGVKQGAFTQNVPKAYADGGENSAPGIGMQTWWSKGDQTPCSGACGDNSITLYGFSYESRN